jgi:hypothetical protein
LVVVAVVATMVLMLAVAVEAAERLPLRLAIP